MPETQASATNRLDQAQDRLEAAIRIDKFDLDNEIVDQPRYMNEVGQRHADAMSYRDEAKANLRGAEALTNQEIRADPDKYGGKLTVDAVKSLVEGHPRVQRAAEILAAWEDRVNRWKVLWDSVGSRSRMLEALTRLYSSPYWADRASSPSERAAKTNIANAATKEVIAQHKKGRAKLPDNME